MVQYKSIRSLCLLAGHFNLFKFLISEKNTYKRCVRKKKQPIALRNSLMCGDRWRLIRSTHITRWRWWMSAWCVFNSFQRAQFQPFFFFCSFCSYLSFSHSGIFHFHDRGAYYGVLYKDLTWQLHRVLKKKFSRRSKLSLPGGRHIGSVYAKCGRSSVFSYIFYCL